MGFMSSTRPVTSLAFWIPNAQKWIKLPVVVTTMFRQSRLPATNTTIKTRLPWSLSTLPGLALVVREKKWRLTNAANPRGLMLETPLNTPSRSNVFAQTTRAEPVRQKQPSVQKTKDSTVKRIVSMVNGSATQPNYQNQISLLLPSSRCSHARQQQQTFSETTRETSRGSLCGRNCFKILKK